MAKVSNYSTQFTHALGRNDNMSIVPSWDLMMTGSEWTPRIWNTNFRAYEGYFLPSNYISYYFIGENFDAWGGFFYGNYNISLSKYSDLLLLGSGDDQVVIKDYARTSWGGDDVVWGGDGNDKFVFMFGTYSTYTYTRGADSSGSFVIISMPGTSGTIKAYGIENFFWSSDQKSLTYDRLFDQIAPTVSTFSPADGATGVAVASDVVLTFSEAIARGTGNIVLRAGSATGTVVETFDAATSTRLSISGSTLTINPTSNLAGNTQYFVTFAPGSIKDLADNSYAGTTTYDFTTVANDTLVGGAGADTLDGGAGNDIMLGGAGNDTYVVDSTGDRVFETTTTSSTIDAGGIDAVLSSISFNLDAYAGLRFVENLTLTGTGSINATGNALANRLTGNAGNNRLDGGAGNDIMLGGAGNDTYLVDSTGDRVFETTTTSSTIDAGGIDAVLSSIGFNLDAYAGLRFVENLTLTGTGNINATGNALANRLTGNAGNNRLDGGAGNDTLNGGTGNDILAGGSGADYFDLTTLINSTTNVDTIADFSRSDDIIRLENAVMSGLGATTGILNAFSFVSGEGLNVALDALDRIIYNTTTGELYYDSDGTGISSPIKIAVIGNSIRPILDHTDFLII
jgi:Ca2+-binding RTX toxin-like protein